MTAGDYGSGMDQEGSTTTPARDVTVSDATLRALAERAIAAESAFAALPTRPTRAYWAARRVAMDAIGALAGELMPGVVLSLLDRADALDWMPEVLNMVHERLQAYLGTDAIAPMFYDDAITSVAYKAAFGELPEQMYPAGSLLHRLRAAEQDTARLNWLEAVRPRVGLDEDGAARLLARDGEGALLASRPAIREAIDAAMREERPEADAVDPSRSTPEQAEP